MGGKGSKQTGPLLFGTVKTTGHELFKENVIVLEPNELPIGKSKDLKFRISSFEVGVFHIQAKYLGAVLKECAFKHAYMIELLHGAQTDDVYRRLAERYSYVREGNKMPFGRGYSFDITRLLPYLYQRFALQELSEEGQQLVQQTHFRRLDSISQAVKRADAENNKWQEATMQQAIRELEELENGLKIQTVVTKGS